MMQIRRLAREGLDDTGRNVEEDNGTNEYDGEDEDNVWVTAQMRL